jgi:excisionase family DNA binding protein
MSPLLDANQAAALLNVPASWVLSEARAERLPHVRLGRYVRFEEDALDAWWRERARGPWKGKGAAARQARTGSNPVVTNGKAP